MDALDRAIAKWRRIEASTKALDLGGRNCALCKAYKDCWNCPVKKRVGVENCYDTPYEDWARHATQFHLQKPVKGFHRVPYCRECVKLAKAELNFLISLRD